MSNILLELNPTQLTTDLNVRTDLRLNKSFLASIKQNGVLEPIVAYPDPDTAGAYRVHLGHRRTAAAIEAELATVPVYVITARQAQDRIVEQLVENTHRQQLTPLEQANAFKQLQLDGMPAIQIAKRTSTKMATVGDAIKTVENPDAVQLLATHQIDLAQAALIAEFADDADLTNELVEVAEQDPGQLEHQAQRARDERAAQRHRTELVAAAKKAKLTLVDKPQAWQGGNKHQVLEDLVDKTTGAPVDPAEHANCPGHGAYIGDIGRYVNNRYVNETKTWLICTDPAKHGHRNINRTAPVPITDEIRAARKKEREDKADWLAASTVRAEWILNNLIAGSYARSGPAAEWFIGAAHTIMLFKPSMGTHKDLAAGWLGAGAGTADRRFGYDRLAYWLDNNPTQGLVLALAVALAGMEDVITNPKGDTKGWADDRGKIGPYLEKLCSLGYSLAPIEKTVVQNDRDRLARASK